VGLRWDDSTERALVKGNRNMTFESRNWGEGNFRSRSNETFEGVVQQLPPNVKQAMYAAANRNLIRRGTWNGCAFNAGSLEEFSDDCVSGVRSIQSAASFFNISPGLVESFITKWDALAGTDEECTARLKKAILDAGLFAEPNESRGKRIMRQTVWKSEETRMREQFEEMVEGLDLNASAEESPMAFATTEMGVLLSA